MGKVAGMGRPLRIERAGGWYHVTGRGNERKAIYRDKRDRLHFLELAAAMGLKDYGTVSSAIRRFERLLRRGKVARQQWNQLCQKYKNQM